MRVLQTEKNRGENVGQRRPRRQIAAGAAPFSIGRWSGKRLLIQPPQIAQQHHTGDHERGGVGNRGGPHDAADAGGAVEDGHQRHIEAALAEQGEEDRRELFAKMGS